MSKLQQLIFKAEKSPFSKWLLNLILSRSVPFNAPHHFKIVSAKPGSIKVKLPYRRNNLNHVKGLHACALATLCEFTTGVCLMSKISDSSYRIILKSLRMEYHYQAKMDVFALFEFSDDFISKNITIPLESKDAIFLELEIKVFDTQNNHVCTGFINWQVKKWTKVNLNVN